MQDFYKLCKISTKIPVELFILYFFVVNIAAENPTTALPQLGCAPQLSTEPTEITFNNCTTVDPIYMKECVGKCRSTQHYSKVGPIQQIDSIM